MAVTEQQLSTFKRNMDSALSAFQKSHEDFDKTFEKVVSGHGKLDTPRPGTRPEQPLNEWNRDLQRSSTALNEIVKNMQNLANMTSRYHQARILFEQESAAKA